MALLAKCLGAKKLSGAALTTATEFTCSVPGGLTSSAYHIMTRGAGIREGGMRLGVRRKLPRVITAIVAPSTLASSSTC